MQIKTCNFRIVHVHLRSDLAFQILYENIKLQMYLWILNHNAFSSVGICSELTIVHRAILGVLTAPSMGHDY